MMFSKVSLRLALILIAVPSWVFAQSSARRVAIAVLSFGDSQIGKESAASLSTSLRLIEDLQIADSDQTRAAASGSGYAPSLNMAVAEARTLGAALGSDFYILGDAQTLRRSPSSAPIYFESYASIFVVSSRTGRLVSWQRVTFQAPTPTSSASLLVAALSHKDLRDKLSAAILQALAEEQTARESAIEKGIPVIEEAPDDEKVAEAGGLRLPRPYRRLQPSYPETAAQAEAEATVDVLVDLDKNGEVTHAEIARWAGFGLDEASLETVRKLHFFPAMRNGDRVPLRVLLRYNFRKPPK